MRPATLRAAIAALALVCATGFIAPQGTVVQTKSSGPLQAVISKKPVGTGTGGRQFYQWYLAVYHLVPGQKPVWEFSSPDMGGPLSEVTQAAGGAKLWFPIQTATIVGFANLMSQPQPQVIVETHEAAADCGTGKIAILRLTHHGNIQLDAIVQNSCALTAAIAAGKNGAPDTLTLHGPYYAKDAALCCPTISNATATLAYRNGEWSLSPTYYQLQTTGLHTEDQGKAWRKWLPSLDLEDVRQHLPQSSTSRLDYFICPNQPTANLSYYGFEYAVSGCPNLAGGSAYEHGPAGPERGQALYDYGHQILLFSRGCCSVESFVVAAGIGSPPMPVARADLAGISTHRGLRLGMTQKQVVQIYGPARAEPVPAHPGLVAIAYGAKAPGHTVKCGGQLGDQYFLFAFRDDALTYMEIDTGC